MAPHRVRGLALALLMTVGGASSAAQTPPREMSIRPHCAVSDDPGYAFTKEQSVQVGGGAMFVKAREQRYLDVLRGPQGQPVRYKRTGTTGLEPYPNPKTILDVYELTYDGLDKPLIIYLDAYHFDDALRAPMGFTCGAPIGLNPPGPDTFLAMDDLLNLALERGASRDIAPIPLGADGATTRGVVLDRFRLIARVARSASAAGKPIALDPATRPPDILRQRTVVVAYPLACDDRSIAPQAIDLTSAQGAPAQRQGEYASGESLKTLVPGLDIPQASLATTFNLQAPRPNDIVKITYAEACKGVADVTLTMQYTPARLLTSPMPALPAGAKPPAGPVRLQAQVDLDGTFQRPSYIGGPSQLVEAATQAIKGWTVEPTKINGAAISTPVTLMITFGPLDR